MVQERATANGPRRARRSPDEEGPRPGALRAEPAKRPKNGQNGQTNWSDKMVKQNGQTNWPDTMVKAGLTGRGGSAARRSAPPARPAPRPALARTRAGRPGRCPRAGPAPATRPAGGGGAPSRHQRRGGITGRRAVTDWRSEPSSISESSLISESPPRLSQGRPGRGSWWLGAQ